MTPLAIYRKNLDRLLAERDHALRSVREEKQALKTAQEILQHTLTAQKITQTAAEGVQQSAHRQLASVVTRCLQAVFGEEDAYTFSIKFVQKRGRTEAVLTLSRGGLELEDPMEECGGGVIDIASFALRLACLILTHPAKRRLLVLDEPWRCLSSQYRPAVRELISLLAKELGVQFIIVTHSPDFVTGNVIELD